MKISRKNIKSILLSVFFIMTLISCTSKDKTKAKSGKTKMTYVLDMVFNNPGEEPTKSEYNDPNFLKSRGYNGMVGEWYVNCGITYDNFEKGIVPVGSKEREWIEKRAQMIDEKLKACDKAGIRVYAFVDVFVAPQSIWKKYGAEMGQEETDFHGYGGNVKNVRKPSIQKPMVQRLIRAQIDGIFDRFPSLAGVVIRFGETYLQDTPFHMGGKPVGEGEQGIKDHVKLINILRDEVCVKRNKKLIYRTWDFGWFHTQPKVYLAITNQIKPHKNLIFSIKHTKGDFQRTFPFNPTLGIGKHQQIVEVQCQREYEGKGAHPDYIANGVLNGFEEYEDMAHPKCLNDLKNNPNLCGVWTWSRGGGWKGPYISNELWCDLNAFVISKWAQNPDMDEAKIFDQYTKLLGLSAKDASAFRQITLLSAHGVLLGRSSKITRINPWWIRDQFMGGLTTSGFNSQTSEAWGKLNEDFEEIVRKNLVDSVLDEKDEAVKTWEKIEQLSKGVTTGSDQFRDYLTVSCTYGRIKYDIIRQGWIVMLKGLKGDKTHEYDRKAIQTAYQKYEKLWKEFADLKANNEQCATLYIPYGFNNKFADFHSDEGMDKAVKKYAEKVGSLAKTN